MCLTIIVRVSRPCYVNAATHHLISFREILIFQFKKTFEIGTTERTNEQDRLRISRDCASMAHCSDLELRNSICELRRSLNNFEITYIWKLPFAWKVPVDTKVIKKTIIPTIHHFQYLIGNSRFDFLRPTSLRPLFLSVICYLHGPL